MTCPEIQDALSARQDGELTPSRREAVDRHLTGCAACRAVAHDLAELDRYLLQSPPIPHDPDLAARLTAQLYPPPVHLLPPPRPSWLLRATALIALLATAALLAPRDRPPVVATPSARPVPPDVLRLREELAATARDLHQLRTDLSAFGARAATEARRTDQAIASKLPEASK